MMRITHLLLTLLLTVAPLAPDSAATVRRLVIVDSSDTRSLQAIASIGPHIVDQQTGTLAAWATDAEIRALKRRGLSVRVLDRRANASYYVLNGPFASDPTTLASTVHPYGTDSVIVQAEPEQIADLAQRCADIKRLPLRILPPPSGTPRIATTITWRADVQAMLSEVSVERLEAHICKLQDDEAQDYCNEMGTRYSFTLAAIREAADYIHNEYVAMGVSVAYEQFEYAGTQSNLVAELPGIGASADQIIVVGAHYDSVSSAAFTCAPGADDNASGSSAVLEAARILSAYRFPRTIRFVHFAAEEQGMIGSQYYAQQALARGDDIRAVINLDMIGYTNTPADLDVEIHTHPEDPNSIAIADVLINVVSTYDLALAPQKLTVNASSRSDHCSFWDCGYPAVMCTEDWTPFNPHYHTVNDTLSRLHMPLIAEYTRAVVGAVADLAGYPVEATPTPLRLWLPIMLREP